MFGHLRPPLLFEQFGLVRQYIEEMPQQLERYKIVDDALVTIPAPAPEKKSGLEATPLGEAFLTVYAKFKSGEWAVGAGGVDAYLQGGGT